MKDDWAHFAACKDYQTADGERWPWDTDGIPYDRDQEQAKARLAVARKICGQCLVWLECLSFGHEQDLADEHIGIYGGYTPEERAEMRGQFIEFRGKNRRLTGTPLPSEQWRIP